MTDELNEARRALTAMRGAVVSLMLLTNEAVVAIERLSRAAGIDMDWSPMRVDNTEASAEMMAGIDQLLALLGDMGEGR